MGLLLAYRKVGQFVSNRVYSHALTIVRVSYAANDSAELPDTPQAVTSKRL
jgi:hypothetical protein